MLVRQPISHKASHPLNLPISQPFSLRPSSLSFESKKWISFTCNLDPKLLCNFRSSKPHGGGPQCLRCPWVFTVAGNDRNTTFPSSYFYFHYSNAGSPFLSSFFLKCHFRFGFCSKKPSYTRTCSKLCILPTFLKHQPRRNLVGIFKGEIILIWRHTFINQRMIAYILKTKIYHQSTILKMRGVILDGLSHYLK